MQIEKKQWPYAWTTPFTGSVGVCHWRRNACLVYAHLRHMADNQKNEIRSFRVMDTGLEVRFINAPIFTLSLLDREGEYTAPRASTASAVGQILGAALYVGSAHISTGYADSLQDCGKMLNRETSIGRLMRRSPWGAVQEYDWEGRGVLGVHTAGHGGVHVDAHRRDEIPKYLSRWARRWSGNGAWYEEDECMAIPMWLLLGKPEYEERYQRVRSVAREAAYAEA